MAEKAQKSSKKQSTSDAAEAKATKLAAEKLEAAREKFGEVATGVEQKVRQMRDGAGRASTQMREKAQAASEVAREKAQVASEVAREKYGVARENVKQGYDKVTKDLDQLNQDVNEYVRANPGKAIAMAAGVGFVIGLLMRGGRRD